MIEQGHIEISIDVKVLAGVGFTIDRAEWSAMSDADKRARISNAVEMAGLQFSQDTIGVSGLPGGFISMEIIGPFEGEIDLTTASTYDPEA